MEQLAQAKKSRVLSAALGANAPGKVRHILQVLYRPSLQRICPATLSSVSATVYVVRCTPLTALLLIVLGPFRKKRVSVGNARAAKRAQQYEELRR